MHTMVVQYFPGSVFGCVFAFLPHPAYKKRMPHRLPSRLLSLDSTGKTKRPKGSAPIKTGPKKPQWSKQLRQVGIHPRLHMIIRIGPAANGMRRSCKGDNLGPPSHGKAEEIERIGQEIERIEQARSNVEPCKGCTAHKHGRTPQIFKTPMTSSTLQVYKNIWTLTLLIYLPSALE